MNKNNLIIKALLPQRVYYWAWITEENPTYLNATQWGWFQSFNGILLGGAHRMIELRLKEIFNFYENYCQQNDINK